MKKIKQFRYYGGSSDDSDIAIKKNSPSEINRNNLITGSIFQGYFPILQLGVQSLPGVKFYVNNSTEPIYIGSTGIYELDLNNGVEISSLSFDYESVDMVDNNEMSNAHIIVDIVYEAEED